MQSDEIETTLDNYARAGGVTAVEPHYIWGEFSVEHCGETLYSDEAHEYCKGCADARLAKVSPLLPADKRKDHFVSATTCDSEDTCKHCRVCGTLLEYALSDSGVESEMDHFEMVLPTWSRLDPGDAYHIARIVEAAPEDEAVLAIARSALSLIPSDDDNKGQ